ncbi:carboxypeptidase-like regulatory domain-containing protein [Vagococcus hydrophili]|uniref:Carboxypeptidase regulatory-like domain-containing protein n=1 Tax=Vagococcus hydrophili TaxID=2714947 RepID=A0A6G8AT23_9ENTE|nr:carboxypeptidase-like regulatory domain-containing protein [Vagococcus hydrophili]QIL48228.1 carboxypeptidase regulatory-like domain-containing protein [Vagococcus hydrophili]
MKKQPTFLLVLIALFSILIITIKPECTEAANYTAYSESDLKRYLELPTSDTVTLGGPISLNSRITVKSNKVLDLNKQVLTANESSFSRSGGFNLTNTTGFTNFTIKNGLVTGGPTEGLDAKLQGLIFADASAYNLTVTAENMKHDGPGFFYGRSSDIVFKGKIDLQNEVFNARALNMTMYGNPLNPNDANNTDFYGYVDAPGSANPGATGKGGVNLSFDGYKINSARSIGKPTKNLYVSKNAKVELKNDKPDKDLIYRNNVGNFAEMRIDGEFIAEAQGSSLRTTSAFDRNEVGTKSDQSEINVNPGSIFKISTVNEKNTHGVVYTYNVDINVNNAEVFDIRNFGSGVFFHGWNNRPYNNFRIYNSDIGVWTESSKGIGNPLYLWQDVKFTTILDFHYKMKGNKLTDKVSSSNPDIPDKFNINEFSRISNDVALPRIIPDKKTVGNNEKSISGGTKYVLPDGRVIDKPAANAKVTLKIDGGGIYNTTTDANGKWSLNNLDLTSVKGGSTGTFTMVDADQRYGDAAYITIEDRIPPKVVPKLVKEKLNIFDNLKTVTNALASYSDETSTKFDIQFLTSQKEREEMVKAVGKYDVKVKVTDEAGNSTTVTAPVIVYEPTNPPTTNGFASGKDFEVDYDKWTKGTDAEKRQIMIDEKYGATKGYEISGDKVTEVTDNPDKMTIDFSGHKWEPKKTYPITVKVGTFKTTINVKLVPAAVKMNVKQVYKGTDKPIFTNLSEDKPIDNSKEIEVKIGDSLETIVDEMIKSGKFQLNYSGYNKVKIKDYKVKINNQLIETDKVPDQGFQLIYEYEGQMKFAKAPTLDFGNVEISSKDKISKLSSESQDEVSIINTFLDYGWTLKASLPKGITNKQTGEEFLGQLLYFDNDGEKHAITDSGANLTSQKKTDKSLSTIDIRGNQNSGMRLEQHIGNTKDEYSGELIWSLEDGPKE